MKAATIPWKKLENPDYNAFPNKYTNMKIPDESTSRKQYLHSTYLSVSVLWPSKNNDERFLVLLTDSVALMLKAAANLKVFYTKLIHVTSGACS
ncbi:unnamed protein product, partial [Timema podura]|nr:unnamed protein product [Timema podura]